MTALARLSLANRSLVILIAAALSVFGAFTIPQLKQQLRDAGDTKPWAVVATAHPAKFDSIVEPLVGHPVKPPPALAAWLARPAHAEPLDADYQALRTRLLAS